MKSLKVILLLIVGTSACVHSQTDTSVVRKSSIERFLIGSATVSGQIIAGYGLGYLGYSAFVKPHQKVPPWAFGGWFVGSTLGVYVVGELMYSDGSPFYTFAGGLVGGFAGILLIRPGQDGSGYSLIIMSILGELISYHLSLPKVHVSKNVTMTLFPKDISETIQPLSLSLLQVEF